MRLLRLWVLAGAVPLLAQTSPEAPATPDATRQELLESLRRKKSQALRPPQRGGLENFLYNFREKRVLERFMAGWHGFHPRLGRLTTGSGFASGVEFRKERAYDGLLDVRAGALVSIRHYQKYEFQIGLPRLANEHVFLGFHAKHLNYPQEDFFGFGPRSRAQDRTNFRLETTSYLGTAGLRWRRWFSAGLQGGLLNTNVGPGTDSRFPSAELVFSEANTPGLERQPDYLQVGAFGRVDYRDEPDNPRSGGHYLVEWNKLNARDGLPFSFWRVETELQQYFPFFNRRRVIAFRWKTSLTDPTRGQIVPFYMLPTLGGSEDLRGFHEFRFRDKNLVVYNLEYRWEAFTGLDMALFGDAGKVFDKRGDFRLSKLEGAYGIGFRFNQAKAVFLRVDIGHSREGTRYFFKFGHVF